jgi:hypothetical protein
MVKPEAAFGRTVVYRVRIDQVTGRRATRD